MQPLRQFGQRRWPHERAGCFWEMMAFPTLGPHLLYQLLCQQVKICDSVTAVHERRVRDLSEVLDHAETSHRSSCFHFTV